MPASGQHFEEFKPHSRHKHLILEYYIRGWTRKLLLRRDAGHRVRLVDACAGTGRDDAGNPGSPVIAARAAAEARAQLADLNRDVRIDVTAIEKKPSYFRELTTHLSAFGESVTALPGTLSDHIERIERDGDIPTFYFVDPFGMEPLNASLLRRILGARQNEVFLLFSDQSALRHLGAVQSVETRAMRDLRHHDEQTALFADDHAAAREALQIRAQASQGSLEVTRERAFEILDAAFGGRQWFGELEQVRPHERRAKFLELYQELLVDSGAPYTQAVPMLDADGDHVYFLVHATRSPAGHQLMKESVEHALKHSPLPPRVVDDVYALLRTDPAPVAAMIRERFAGQTVRWTEDRDNRSTPSLRKFVLGETALYPFQADELKVLLQSWRLPGRTIVFRFPV